jgi:hypothetical protein
MKKIISIITIGLHCIGLIGQVVVPPRVDTLFSSFQPTYLSDFEVRKLPCNFGISHSMASSNVFGEILTGSNLGMSLNYTKDDDMYRPKGVFRLFNLTSNTSKYFYTRTTTNGVIDLYNDTMSLHNSTFSNGKYLVSGTHIKYPLIPTFNPSIGGSFAIIGDINVTTNKVKYHQIMPIGLMNATNIGQSWNNNGAMGNDIIDVTSTSAGEIYAVGTVSNSLLLPDGYMYLCHVDNANNLLIYPLYDPALISSTNPYLPEMMPQKIFLDEAENVIYVIGRQVTQLPPFLGSTRTIVPFIVKYDLNSRTYTFKNYSTLLPNSGRFFDMKKAANGNYILGYSGHAYLQHGYLEIDPSFNIVKQEMYDGSSINSASNPYAKGSNTLISNFGHNIYTDIHLPDNDNIHFYGWNTNGMAFANLYIGSMAISSSSPFYGIILGNDYLTAEFPPIMSLTNYQFLATSQYKFHVFEGLYPNHRKSLTMLNGNYNFFASIPDSNKTCSNDSRKDRILSRFSPINFAYGSSITAPESDFIQYVPTNSSSPSIGNYQGHSEVFDTCISVLPIDYYSDAYPYHLMEYETFTNNLDLQLGFGADFISTFEEDINWINDDLRQCDITNNVQYYQKSAQNIKMQDSKILNIEIFDMVGRKLSLGVKEYIGQKYSTSLEKDLINLLGKNSIYFISIVTERGVSQLKISKE